ncbi:MAG: DEAD/DEAH box helicase, partial [Bacteroidaceae bacterium]|nr:DEAD/DEAH box helicase [Bacteroidaceae bacterium]
SGQPVVQGMVIVPSRELALQTCEVVRQSGTQVKALALYGGRPTMDEHRSLRGIQPQLVIGTPGRLLDHLTKGNIETSAIHTLVIDEFDKCLELGFRDEMTQVFSHLTNVRKRVLLSATDNPEITKFLPTYTRLDYLDETPISDRIRQFLVRSPQKDKLETLRDLLLTTGEETSLVFVGYRESVERVAGYLRQQSFVLSALHGGMEQRDREQALFRFVAGSANILVSTDLASRGLDIPELNNVIHYHLPLNQEAFIHRNGRTARWDKEGRSYIILGPEESLPEYVGDTENYSLGEANKNARPCLPRWESLYIGKGKKDKLSRGDIAGFLMKVGGLQKDEVGRIDVRDHYSYVAVSRKQISETLARLRGQKIKGMKTIFERAR